LKGLTKGFGIRDGVARHVAQITAGIGLEGLGPSFSGEARTDNADGKGLLGGHRGFSMIQQMKH
jgi:hypothetical protein